MRWAFLLFMALSVLNSLFSNSLPGSLVPRQIGLIVVLAVVYVITERRHERHRASRRHPQHRASRRRRGIAVRTDHTDSDWEEALELWRKFPFQCWGLILVSLVANLAAVLLGAPISVAIVLALMSNVFLYAWFSDRRAGSVTTNWGTFDRVKEPVEFWFWTWLEFLSYAIFSGVLLFEKFFKLP